MVNGYPTRFNIAALFFAICGVLMVGCGIKEAVSGSPGGLLLAFIGIPWVAIAYFNTFMMYLELTDRRLCLSGDPFQKPFPLEQLVAVYPYAYAGKKKRVLLHLHYMRDGKLKEEIVAPVQPDEFMSSLIQAAPFLKREDGGVMNMEHIDFFRQE